MGELNERVAVMENKIEANSVDIQRIFKELKVTNDTNNDLNSTMKVLNVTMLNFNETLTEKINTLTKEVKEVTEVPKKRLDTIIASIISALVAAAMAYFIGKK